jgi:hypothetical protein
VPDAAEVLIMVFASLMPCPPAALDAALPSLPAALRAALLDALLLVPGPEAGAAAGALGLLP